ncbi:NADH dehydrogenase [Pseudomonas pohangensis]|uniref:NADH dehydrogenase n=1 Tax=Pseudomonas pohangensis TaxID=364197 RepID=A0A1H2FH22_9PSED|nr:FAD-dependent oxidoreductase [Pseudomonas pohangensis]SDU06573.1 NADH dehydrogenase [Pseudomonas pohangensis]
MSDAPVIVVVGGGAGGLELVTRLGRSLGKKGLARIILVDGHRYHLWKPLLHELAAGTIDPGSEAIRYHLHALKNHFEFVHARMVGLDRQARQLMLSAFLGEGGVELLPERPLHYDHLVIAVGSVCNDFGIPGIKEHCLFLDTAAAAERLQSLLQAYGMKANMAQITGSNNPQDFHLNVAIVGGGATGVELSAELQNVLLRAQQAGYKLRADALDTTLIETAPRILQMLPESISSAATKGLQDAGVKVRTGVKVREATAQGFVTDQGELIEAELRIWSAGVKCEDYMKGLGGLETTGNNQLVMNADLRTSRDSHIWALGDCAYVQMADGSVSPARAAAAHQMASVVYRNLHRVLSGEPTQAYVYKEMGSLINLSQYKTLGSLIGLFSANPLLVEGRIARLMYVSLYRMHQAACFGIPRTILRILIDRLDLLFKGGLKLH